jgi:predicted nicotinamide N-methyase
MDEVDESEIEVRVQPDVCVRLLQSESPDAVLERAVLDDRVDPYAHIVWPSSVAAARAVTRFITPGMHVLDVGAGTGLCAITAAVMGAQAAALDRDAPSLARITRAAALNGVSVETVCFDIFSRDPMPHCELAVFADLLYETALASAVADRVTEMVRRGAVCIIADPGRAGRATFDAHASARGFAVAYDDVEVQLPGDTPAVVQVAVVR